MIWVTLLKSSKLVVKVDRLILNHTYFSISLRAKECNEPSVLSTFVMLSSIPGNVKEEGYKQSSARARVVDEFKRKGVFKVNKGVEDKFCNSFS